MRRLSRIFWLLLCLIVMANSSAPAAFPTSGALARSHREAEDVALLGNATALGLADDHAVALCPGQGVIRDGSPSLSHRQHHHPCHHPCALFGAVPAPLSLPPMPSRNASIFAVARGLASDIVAPPVHPPRDRG